MEIVNIVSERQTSATKPRRAAKAKTKTKIPTTRKLAVSGVIKTVPFNPERAMTLLEINTLTQIEESIGFWFSRLREQACPKCAIKGALEVQILPYGIEVTCIRADTGKCTYSQEVHF
jgi:hypothetical protein